MKVHPRNNWERAIAKQSFKYGAGLGFLLGSAVVLWFVLTIVWVRS